MLGDMPASAADVRLWQKETGLPGARQGPCYSCGGSGRNAKGTWTACAARVDRRRPPSRGTLSTSPMAAKQSFAAIPLAGPFAFNGAQGDMCGFCSGSRVDASCDRSSLNP